MKLMGAEFHFRGSVSDSCCCARWLTITNGLVGHLNGTGPSLTLLVTAALFFFFLLSRDKMSAVTNGVGHWVDFIDCVIRTSR